MRTVKGAVMSYLDKKGYHTWTYTTEKGAGLQEVEFRVDEETTLDGMLECFQSYLRATGFSFDGDIDVFDEIAQPNE